MDTKKYLNITDYLLKLIKLDLLINYALKALAELYIDIAVLIKQEMTIFLTVKLVFIAHSFIYKHLFSTKNK